MNEKKQPYTEAFLETIIIAPCDVISTSGDQTSTPGWGSDVDGEHGWT